MDSSGVSSSQHDTDNTSVSESDSKKRNKLGYHRTAVACGHCRRRKIRCIPSLDSTEVRCQNCIRLKKDCQFYPVDQNGPSTRKPRPNSNTDVSAHASIVIATSPSPDTHALAATGSYDTNIASVDPVNGAWHEITSGDSNSRITDQSWGTPLLHHAPSQFVRHNSHPVPLSESYWTPSSGQQHEPYSQPCYDQAALSTAYPEDSQIPCDKSGFNEIRQSMQHRSYSGISGGSMPPTPEMHRHYHATMPGIERSVTLPATYLQHDGSRSRSAQSPPLSGTNGQYPYNYVTQFENQNLRSNSPWFTSATSPSLMVGSYLPSQRDRHTQFAEYPG